MPERKGTKLSGFTKFLQAIRVVPKVTMARSSKTAVGALKRKQSRFAAALSAAQGKKSMKKK